MNYIKIMLDAVNLAKAGHTQRDSDGYVLIIRKLEDRG